MSYAHRLRYAGSKPFEPERDRVNDGDLTHQELEVLEQDEIYRRLAEVRWLATHLENDLDDAEAAPVEVWSEVFDAIGVRDAPLEVAVEEYVDRWLNEYRGAEEVTV